MPTRLLPQAPCPGDALERVLAAIGEVDAGADDEVLDRVRDEHLARRRQRTDARTDVDGESADVVADRLALARVQTRAQLDAQIAHCVAQLERTADRPRRPVERCEEGVAERLHRASAVARELRTAELVVTREQLTPGTNAEARSRLGRTDDVGEHDGRKHAIR